MRGVPSIATAAGLVALAFSLVSAATPGSGPRRSVVFAGRAMGNTTRVVLVTADSISAVPLARVAHSVFARVDSLMSNWTTTSEVARLNREAAAGHTPVHPEVARVLEASLDLWRQSEGANDITVEPLVRAWGFIGGRPRVPSPAEATAAFHRVGAGQLDYRADTRSLRFANPGVQIDLGGIAKGYSVDVVVDSLVAHGVRDALVEISGNLVAMGRPAGAEAWRIGVRDPHDRLPYFGRIALRDQAISTSGKYEQFVAADGKTYGHIMDPRSGRPAEGLISVTVVAPTAMACDGWDTPLFVLGAADARRVSKARADLSAILVAPGSNGVDTVWVERDLETRFTLDRAARSRFVLRVY